VNYILSSVTM